MPQNYRNFTTAIYARVYEVNQMADLAWLQQRFDVMSRHIRVDKIYLETHRDMVVAEEKTLAQAREFFAARGIRTSGGITITVNEMNRFQTYCYTNPEHRQMLKDVVQFTARQFDEVILDDFFFTNCKCETCIAAKGERSWTQFRLELMTEAAQSLVIGPAREANPRVELVIKYPNWYEHFQGLGFNLETEPALFDRLYTGTETRDPVVGNQHLQPYHGYQIFRFFENLKPGCNGGGWVDTGGMRSLDRYAEQLWLTLFAKAPEITLFDFRQLQRPIQPGDRGSWQGQATSLDFDTLLEPYRQPGGNFQPEATIALAAGAAFELVDGFLGELGNPVGVQCYKPFHSTGEDYLHNYLGMLGIPIDLHAAFPAGAGTVLLTESVKFDSSIVEKIKGQLAGGKNVAITSGLLRALQGKGIEDIVELEVTERKAMVDRFLIGWNNLYPAKAQMLIPVIQYLTNDSWEEISGQGNGSGYPLLHSAGYAGGRLFVLTIPDNLADLYLLPREVLARMRASLMGDLYVSIDAPAQVALFAYDNHTLIVESFLDEAVDLQIMLDSDFTRLEDLLSGEEFSGEAQVDWRGKPTGKTGYHTSIKPHSYRVFRCG